MVNLIIGMVKYNIRECKRKNKQTLLSLLKEKKIIHKDAT